MGAGSLGGEGGAGVALALPLPFALAGVGFLAENEKTDRLPVDLEDEGRGANLGGENSSSPSSDDRAARRELDDEGAGRAGELAGGCVGLRLEAVC